MIGILPQPYPDELAYSVQARYASALGCAAFVVEYHVHGTKVNQTPPLRSIYPAVAPLTPLGRPVEPERWSAWLHDQTFWPYRAHFIPAKEALSASNGRRRRRMQVSPVSGLGTYGFRDRDWLLRHCGTCAGEDRRTVGEPYWRRAHNVPGTVVCPLHGDLLTLSDERLARSRSYRPLSDCTGGRVLKVPGRLRGALYRIARMNRQLLLVQPQGFAGLLAARLYWHLHQTSRKRRTFKQFADTTMRRLMGSPARAVLLQLGAAADSDFSAATIRRAIMHPTTQSTPTLTHVLIAVEMRLDLVWRQLLERTDAAPHSALTLDLPFCGSRRCRRCSPDWRERLRREVESTGLRRWTQCRDCRFTACDSLDHAKPRITNRGETYWAIAEELYDDRSLRSRDVARVMGDLSPTILCGYARERGVYPPWRGRLEMERVHRERILSRRPAKQKRPPSALTGDSPDASG